MNATTYEVARCETLSTSQSHCLWVRIFASGSCFQILYSLRSSLNARYHVLHPYNTTGDIVLYVLMFKLLEYGCSRRSDNNLEPENRSLVKCATTSCRDSDFTSLLHRLIHKCSREKGTICKTESY